MSAWFQLSSELVRVTNNGEERKWRGQRGNGDDRKESIPRKKYVIYC